MAASGSQRPPREWPTRCVPLKKRFNRTDVTAASTIPEFNIGARLLGSAAKKDGATNGIMPNPIEIATMNTLFRFLFGRGARRSESFLYNPGLKRDALRSNATSYTGQSEIVRTRK